MIFPIKFEETSLCLRGFLTDYFFFTVIRHSVLAQSGLLKVKCSLLLKSLHFWHLRKAIGYLSESLRLGLVTFGTYFTAPLFIRYTLTSMYNNLKSLAGSATWIFSESLCKTSTSFLGYPKNPFQFWSRSDPWGRQLHPSELCGQRTIEASGGWRQRGQPSHSGCFLVRHNLHTDYKVSRYADIYMDRIRAQMIACT